MRHIATSTDRLDADKQRYDQDTAAKTLGDVIADADVFLGLSSAGVLKPEMVAKMGRQPIILAERRCGQHHVQRAARDGRRRRHGRRDPARRGATGARHDAVVDRAAHRQHDGGGRGRRTVAGRLTEIVSSHR